LLLFAGAGAGVVVTDDDDDDDDDDDEDEDEDISDENATPLPGKPKSRMTDYATQFLDRTSSEEDDSTPNDQFENAARIKAATLDNISDATHLIAIPMESSYELLIELESVQRAILHHCPILLDACISGATTRLPLLYIQVPGASQNENSQISASVTCALARTVQRLVKKHIFGAGSTRSIDGVQNTKSSDEGMYNAEGYRPLSMTFHSLEIDGKNNNILNTVGTFSEGDHLDEKDYNENRFENLMQDLQSVIASQGWKMAFPPDPKRSDSEKNGIKSFRPRISFMELPASFDENISRFKKDDTEIMEEDMKFLTAEEGGNGISPIFWCNWWDDVFARNVRLQEIGIYPRSPGLVGTENEGLTTNSQFYIPFETIPLPNGNVALLKSEKKFSEYYDKRLKEEEEKFRKENFENKKKEKSKSQQASQNPLSSMSSNSSEPDILMSKTRKRLEGIYLNSGNDNSVNIGGDVNTFDSTQQEDEDLIDFVDMNDKVRSQEDDYIEDWMLERIMRSQEESPTDDEDKISDTTQDRDEQIDSIENMEISTDPISSDKDDGYVDDWMKEKVKKAVSSMESVKNKNVIKDEPKFSIEDNPVFKAYKEGTLAANQPAVNEPNLNLPTKQLGPYPSNDHFIGIWKVITSPMGYEGSNNRKEGSENIILRVDGTTAAGPTLNPKTNQKAAGGTWKTIVQENGDVVLRIRLVVPPEKSRIVVMEGLVERGSPLGIKTASRNFGIAQLEEKEKEANKMKEDILTCSGEAYIEDAITKKNKVGANFFSLTKVLASARDPSEYTITIPKTIRRLD